MRAGIHTLPIIRDVAGREDLGLGLVGELLGTDGLGGKIDLHALGLGLFEDGECIRHEVVLVQGIADLAALGLDEGVTHAATDDEVVDLADEVLEDGELGGDLGASDDGRQRALGLVEYMVDGLDLAFHQVAEHLVIREILGDEGGGGVSAVSGTESVVDVAVGIGSEMLHELLLAGLDGSLGCGLLLVGSVLCESAGLALLLCIVTEILEQQDLARLEGGGLCVGLHAIVSELHRNAKALGHAGHDVLEGELGVHLLGTSQVGHDDEGTTFCEHLLEGRHGPADAGVVGDLEILVQRNVEIYADDGFLAGKIVRINVLLHKYKN